MRWTGLRIFSGVFRHTYPELAEGFSEARRR